MQVEEDAGLDQGGDDEELRKSQILDINWKGTLTSLLVD